MSVKEGDTMSYRGWTMDETTAEALVSEAHIACIECGGDGCTGCPSAFCELPRLVEHQREHVHEGCKGATAACAGTGGSMRLRWRAALPLRESADGRLESIESLELGTWGK